MKKNLEWFQAHRNKIVFLALPLDAKCTAVFINDDRTPEDAFQAQNDNGFLFHDNEQELNDYINEDEARIADEGAPSTESGMDKTNESDEAALTAAAEIIGEALSEGQDETSDASTEGAAQESDDSSSDNNTGSDMMQSDDAGFDGGGASSDY